MEKQRDSDKSLTKIELINKLIECLNKEINLYEEILILVKEKQSLLVQNRELDLEPLLLNLNKLSEEAKELDNKRAEILKKLGLSAKNLTWLMNFVNKTKTGDYDIISQIKRIENNKNNSVISFLSEELVGNLESLNSNIIKESTKGMLSDKTNKDEMDNKNEVDRMEDFKNLPTYTFELLVKKTKRLKEIILQISEINNSNIFLIEQGRKNIKAYFDLLFKKFNADVYSQEGFIENKMSKNILINKVF